MQHITQGILRVGAGKVMKLNDRITGGAFKQASRSDVRHQEYDQGHRAPVSTSDFKGTGKKAKVTVIASCSGQQSVAAQLSKVRSHFT